jgi:hypothetical protein
MSFNPLSSHFRASSTTVSLPSQGQYYPSDALERTENNVYLVYPMTMIDEITFKTPASTLHGVGLISVIQSCVPNIKNAWKIPNVDLDAILTAIYIATYGDQLKVESTCPECDTAQSQTINLDKKLHELHSTDYSKTLSINDLEIEFRPMSFEEVNNSGLGQKEEQKIIEMIENTTDDVNVKVEQLSTILQKITSETTKVLALNIKSVKIGNTVVVNQDHIVEWLSKCDRNIFEKVRNFIVALKQTSELGSVDFVCINCQHQYLQKISLDTTSI